MIEQRSQEWFDARLGKATASRFYDIMKGPKLAGWKNYRAQLVTERLTSTIAESFTSQAMQWGTDCEPLARLHYTLKSKNQVEECGFFEHKTLLAGASPDGLIGEDGTLEIKCPSTHVHIDTLRNNKVPSLYYSQVQGQLWITGRKWADFVSFDPRLPENANIVIIHVPRDEQYIKGLETAVGIFLKEVSDEVIFVKNYGKEAGK